MFYNILIMGQSALENPDGIVTLLDYLNYGVIVVGIVALLKGWIVPKYVVDRLQKEKDAYKDELGELRERLDKEVFPKLWETARLLARFANRGENQ